MVPCTTRTRHALAHGTPSPLICCVGMCQAVSRMNSEMNAAKMKAANVPTIDFDAWKSKIETPGLVDALKAVYDKEVAMPELEKIVADEQAKVTAEVKELFHGSNGLVRALASVPMSHRHFFLHLAMTSAL